MGLMFNAGFTYKLLAENARNEKESFIDLIMFFEKS